MQQSDIPDRFNIPFANSAGSSFIRDIPQAHQTPSATDAPASLFDGFPPETFIPAASGGVPPSGADMNGLLNWVTRVARWTQAGGPAIYDAGFVVAIGGYAKGATLASTVTPGIMWTSTVENNTTDPDGVSASGWNLVGATSSSTDGAGNWIRTAPDGWIEMGGVLTKPRSNVGPFTMTFPFGGFPTECLGITAMVRNTTSDSDGSATVQEVSLTQTEANLYVQTHQTSIPDMAGGMRWRAWGR